MNARTQQFEFTVDGSQVEEVVSCVFHTVLLHRSMGKFRYKAEGNYSVGVVGTEDVDCNYIDLTYVRISSPELSQRVSRDALQFADALRASAGNGLIHLELLQKKKSRWPLALQEEVTPWEVWQLHVQLANSTTELRQDKCKQIVGEQCSQAILTICSSINRPQYIPKMPVQSDLPYVFDISFCDVQPYLFRVRHELHDGMHRVAAGQGIYSTAKALLKDTMSL